MRISKLNKLSRTLREQYIPHCGFWLEFKRDSYGFYRINTEVAMLSDIARVKLFKGIEDVNVDKFALKCFDFTLNNSLLAPDLKKFLMALEHEIRSDSKLTGLEPQLRFRLSNLCDKNAEELIVYQLKDLVELKAEYECSNVLKCLSSLIGF